jgi:hypothetical protein
MFIIFRPQCSLVRIKTMEEEKTIKKNKNDKEDKKESAEKEFLKK